MMKQINNTLVIGTIIVPKQECFVLEKYTKEAIYMSRKRLTQVFPFFSLSVNGKEKNIFTYNNLHEKHDFLVG